MTQLTPELKETKQISEATNAPASFVEKNKVAIIAFALFMFVDFIRVVAGSGIAVAFGVLIVDSFIAAFIAIIIQVIFKGLIKAFSK